MKLKKVELKVRGEQFEADKYRDMVRIDSYHRGNDIKSGQLIKLCVKGGECIIVAVRGVYTRRPDARDCIFIDLQTRRRLGVNVRETHTFTFKKATWLEHIRWATQANDPAARVAAWIAIVAFFLALIDIVLGGIQIWQGWR